MTKRDNYHTKQKDKIITLLKEKKKEFTVKEIYQELNEEIGLTTIYRIVDKLELIGRLNKYIKNDNITYYQYLDECQKDNHFYLKCDNCGELIHVDCDCVKELSTHIVEKHNFKPAKEHFIINGICEKCNNQKKEEILC